MFTHGAAFLLSLSFPHGAEDGCCARTLPIPAMGATVAPRRVAVADRKRSANCASHSASGRSHHDVRLSPIKSPIIGPLAFIVGVCNTPLRVGDHCIPMWAYAIRP